MKKTITLAVLTLMASQSFGAIVKSARLDSSKKNIQIEVVYGGGCKQHDFSLRMGGVCLESLPVQCQAELVDNTSDDFCEAIVSSTVTIPVSKTGINPTPQGSYLIITGGEDWQTRQPSSATVLLP